ncbi:MAG: polysaccharide biosynthesis/export family protein [Candidatus Omnitrophica bacterium]|nr:polysaccharide biosynthesis/export family protein [Candidatus Omnitrophota bacterium]
MPLLKRIIIIILFLVFTPFVYSQERRDEALKYYERGKIYYDQGRYTEAQEEFQKAIEILKEKESETKEGVTPLTSKPAEKPIQTEYIIGEDDVLYILVWQNPDLTMDVIVRPDGRISFPLIGDIPAKGLTLSQLDEIITERLKEYIRFPEVSISLKKLGGKKVIVLGEVVRPGVYAVSGARTILEAIGLAGGFTRDAVASSVILIRGGFEKPQAKRLNLTKALKGDLRQNISLQAEDIIFIPKKFISNLTYFLNQVLEPLAKGAYTSKEIQTW